MIIDRKAIKKMEDNLSEKTLSRVKKAARMIIKTKERGGKIVVVLGSGPNLHEGVTTLVAELMSKGIVDGVSTSSAVVNHEMGGTLEKVKRINGRHLGMSDDKLPSDGYMEVSILSDARLMDINRRVPIDIPLYRKMKRAKGDTIIKVAGNMAYPTGLFIERISRDILAAAKRCGCSFEKMAGCGADLHTMIGAGSKYNIPVLVTVPQLVGGGEVGLAVGDSISITERCHRIAKLLDGADLIIESAIALVQEVHDGPFETYTGHGIWANWQGEWSYSLRGKKIIRIDLDPNLEKVWERERKSKTVSRFVHKGLPKTKSFGIPFRMEMSGFARLPDSLPIVGDIGEIWPLIALRVSESLGAKLDFMSYKQSLKAGQKSRDWIVKYVKPVKLERVLDFERRQLRELETC